MGGKRIARIERLGLDLLAPKLLPQSEAVEAKLRGGACCNLTARLRNKALPSIREASRLFSSK
jgi:hypothetical protein